MAEQVDTTMWTGLLHGGLAGSFLGLPHVAPDADALKQHGARAAIYGIPFDATNISRTGANYGPRGIRDVSCQFTTYNATFDFDVARRALPGRLRRLSTIALANPERTFERAQADIGAILRRRRAAGHAGRRALDHDSRGARRARLASSDPGLILIDTHLDTAVDVGGELLNHCCPITRAVDAGFDPAKIALVGISGWMNPRTELALLPRARDHRHLARGHVGERHRGRR